MRIKSSLVNIICVLKPSKINCWHTAFVQKIVTSSYWDQMIRIRIRIRIYLLARRNLLWDILRLPSSRRAALGLYVILTLWRGWGANQPPYALLHRSSLRYALRHGRRRDDSRLKSSIVFDDEITFTHCTFIHMYTIMYRHYISLSYYRVSWHTLASK